MYIYIYISIYIFIYIYIYIYICIYIYRYICKNTENPQNCSFSFTDADKLGYPGSAGNVDQNGGFRQGDKMYGPFINETKIVK